MAAIVFRIFILVHLSFNEIDFSTKKQNSVSSVYLVVSKLLFHKILAELFIIRLRIEKPKVVVLFGDTLILDSDDTNKRLGVEPTYKKKKGFQPLHLSWGSYLIDVVFRNGSTLEPRQ